MALNIAKCTFLFNYEEWGWSESYYQGVGNDIDDPNFVANVAALAKARTRILSRDVQFIGARLSLENVFRDSRLIGNGAPGSPINFLGGWAEPPMSPELALLVRLEAGQLHRRALLLRGCPLGILATAPAADILPNEYNYAYPGWSQALSIWNKALTNQPFLTTTAGQWNVLAEDSGVAGGPPPVPNAPLTAAISATTTGHGLTFQTFTPIKYLGVTLEAPFPIIITGARGTQGVNGRWVVQTYVPANIGPPPTNATYLCFPRPRYVSIPILASGNCNVRALKNIIVPIDRFVPERIDRRKTGRPFGLPHGRTRRP